MRNPDLVTIDEDDYAERDDIDGYRERLRREFRPGTYWEWADAVGIWCHFLVLDRPGDGDEMRTNTLYPSPTDTQFVEDDPWDLGSISPDLAWSIRQMPEEEWLCLLLSR